MLMPLKIAVKITAVSVLASKEGACGFSFLFSLCDRTVSNHLCRQEQAGGNLLPVNRTESPPGLL